ncbi:MAG: class I SAM-dependent methyltransferase [Chthoniobacterales bacterium]
MQSDDDGVAEAVARLQQVWEHHAQDDPLWAILSAPRKRGGKWDLDEFLATGEHEIATLLQTLAFHEVTVDYSAALDFGCGVGRLSQALARRFDRVCGVDISPTMIENAQKLNRHGDKCRYFLNPNEHLQLFPDGQFTFIYSNVVLQHIPPQISRAYLAEFARLARPGGLVVFQLPSRIKVEQGLPHEACSAAITCPPGLRSWPGGIHATLEVTVQNVSREAWHFDEHRPLMLGNHWLDESGAILRLDDGRTVLPNDLGAGASADLVLEVTTPPSAGSYILELDLVQEGVAWFGNRGSPTWRAPVRVLPDANSGNAPRPAASARSKSIAPVPPPVFENFSMHVIPRSEVLRLLQPLGLRLEFIYESENSGPGFQSYVYFMRKAQRAS